MLCDIIYQIFFDDQNKAINLVSTFLKSIEKHNSPIINQSRSRFLNDFVKTDFMKNEQTRTKILNNFYSCLSHSNLYRGFQLDVYPILISLLFNLMNNSTQFLSDIYPISFYFEDLLYTTDSNDLLNFKEFGIHLKKLLNDNESDSSNYIENIIKLTVDKKYINQYSDKFNLMTPFNLEFLMLLLHFLDFEQLKSIVLKRNNPTSFYLKLVLTIKTVVSSNLIPTHINLISVSNFIKLISLVTSQECSFLLNNLADLIKLISGFYKELLISYSSFEKSDKKLYNRIYGIDITPISLIIQKLLFAVGKESCFNSDAFVPIIHFYLHTNDIETRNLLIDTLKMLLESDWIQNNNYSKSANAIAIALDSASKDSDFKDLFELYENLQNSFNNTSEIEHLFKRISQITTFLGDLTKYVESELYEDEITTAIVRILDFTKENNEIGLFTHFSSKLYKFHLLINNLVEAGETLVFCANTFSWDDQSLIEDGHDEPEQPKYIRKQKCLIKSIDLFIKSMFYERALEIINELKEYYLNILIDYEELSILLKKEIGCYQQINAGERNKLNQFYGIKFYGNSFSEYYSNKLFVYRRDGYFKSTDMMRKLQEKFPKAIVSPKEPTEENPDNFIYVFNMKPKLEINFNINDPPSEVMIKSCCEYKEFMSEQPIRIRRKENYGEFAEWHRYVYYYETEKILQSFVRRMLVIKTSEKIIVTPIECAILDTSGKTLELAQKSSIYYRMLLYNLNIEKSAVSNFTMLINGIVNAAVNGGTKLLQDLFLGENDFAKEEINLKYSKDLILSFIDQLKTVKFALNIHKYVVPLEFKPLHDNCENDFIQMVQQMKIVIGEINFNENPNYGILPNLNFLKKFDF